MSDELQVVVAVVGEAHRVWSDPEGGYGGLRHPEDWQVSYADRRKVEISVTPSATLGEVLRATSSQIGAGSYNTGDKRAVFEPAFISFYSDERSDDIGFLNREITLLDEQGRVRWTWDWLNEPLSELLRAAEAGVLDGDPLRPYLLLQPGIGNGIAADFPTFVELWKLWWDVADKAAILTGLILGGRELKSRLARSGKDAGPEKSPDVIASHYAEWAENGARADNITAFLGRRPWHLADVAQLIGCTEAEAQAFLLGLGYERSSSGLWRLGESEPARLIQGSAEFVLNAGMTTRVDAMETVLRERAEAFGRTGKATPLDWEELSQLPSDDSRLEGIGLGDYNPPLTMMDKISVVLRYRASSALYRLQHRHKREGS
jgi:hypothetical protein